MISFRPVNGTSWLRSAVAVALVCIPSVFAGHAAAQSSPIPPFLEMGHLSYGFSEELKHTAPGAVTLVVTNRSGADVVEYVGTRVRQGVEQEIFRVTLANLAEYLTPLEMVAGDRYILEAIVEPGDTDFATIVVFGNDSIGVYSEETGSWFVRYQPQPGEADEAFLFGSGGESLAPLVGRWDWRDQGGPGVYDRATGTVFLKTQRAPGNAEIVFIYGVGESGFEPLAGDWDGNGITSIGLYNPADGTFFLRNSLSSGVADLTFVYGVGSPTVIPLAGDWDGDGVDTIGLYDQATGVFFLKDTNESGEADLVYQFGAPGMIPLAGDWNGDGIDTAGVYDMATGSFFLRDEHGPGNADVTAVFGAPGLRPLSGLWKITFPPSPSERRSR